MRKRCTCVGECLCLPEPSWNAETPESALEIRPVFDVSANPAAESQLERMTPREVSSLRRSYLQRFRKRQTVWKRSALSKKWKA